jgi:putative SOS response-associated peptidase YedK
MRWSLVPHYFKGHLTEFKPVLNNCRSETINEKPTFKRPLKNGQRCVVLAEGFVENCLFFFFIIITIKF